MSPGKPKCKIVLFFQNTVYPGYMWHQETESIQFGLKVWFVIMTLIPRRNNAQLGLMKVVNLSRSKDLTDRTLWPPFAHYHRYRSDTSSLIPFAEFKFLESKRKLCLFLLESGVSIWAQSVEADVLRAFEQTWPPRPVS